jgi:hypothetical protein
MKWMFTIAAVLAATALATAWATPPTEELSTEEAVQTFTDLRNDVGPATADGPGFAEALRQQFAQQQQQLQPAPQTPAFPELANPDDLADQAFRPGAQAWTGDRQFPGPRQAVQRGPQDPRNQPADLYAPVQGFGADNSGWAQPVGRPAFHGQPAPPPRPGPAQPAQRDPKTLLRRSAMELDRLANELEITELYAEADAIREAAGKLRKAARTQAASPTPKPGEPTAAGSPSMEHLRARVKNAMADANRRQAELQAKLAEAEAKLAEATVDEQVRRVEAVTRPMNEREERELRRYFEDGQRRQREGRGRRGHPTQEDGRTSPDLPAPGVHGGPTEPGPAPAVQPYPNE